MGRRIRKFVPYILLLVILVVILINLSQNIRKGDQPLNLSGTIEVVEVEISFEIGGKIDQIMVQEGQQVQAGDAILYLEDERLYAKFESAQAYLEHTQANLALVTDQPLSEQRQVAIAEAQLEYLESHQSLQDLIEFADLTRAEAQKDLEEAEHALEDLLNSQLPQQHALAAITQAEKDLDQARKKLEILTNPPPQTAIDQAYANMLLAGERRDQTSEDIETATQKLKRGLGPYYPKEINDKYKKQLRVAIRNFEIKRSGDQLAYERAVEKYDQLTSPIDPIELSLAEANLAVAEAQLDQKQREYERVKNGPSRADIAYLEAQIEATRREFEALKDGPDPDELAIAQAQVDYAIANLSLAEADDIQEQLAVAQAQVDAAQAALSLIQTQLDKLTLRAPVDGVVLHRAIEPGEVVNPGDSAITIGLLDELRITAYLPEDYFGTIQQSDNVQISVDAYPGKTFSGKIIHIASESEFVYRNVQRPDGGWDSVFAVTIAIDDVEMLKPGILAKIEFPDL